MEKVLNRQASSLYVGMGDLLMGKDLDELICLGLGSCIALVIYSPEKKVAVMAHIMLPKSPDTDKGKSCKTGKFADRAVPEMIDMMISEGMVKRELRAKLVGGARMFAYAKSPAMAIGEQNISRVMELLEEYSIPIEARDTGGTKGRSITFHTFTNSLEVRIIGERTRIL